MALYGPDGILMVDDENQQVGEKTLKAIKTIDVPERFSADGIYCDASDDRVYIGSHPTKSLMVVDAKDGAVLGNIDLGGTPEQTGKFLQDEIAKWSKVITTAGVKAEQ